MKNNYGLGCGKEFSMHTSSGFICGVANAWGSESLCPQCDSDMRRKWADEDRERDGKLFKEDNLKKEVLK